MAIAWVVFSTSGASLTSGRYLVSGTGTHSDKIPLRAYRTKGCLVKLCTTERLEDLAVVKPVFPTDALVTSAHPFTAQIISFRTKTPTNPSHLETRLMCNYCQRPGHLKPVRNWTKGTAALRDPERKHQAGIQQLWGNLEFFLFC